MANRRSSISDEILSYVHNNDVNITDRIIYLGGYTENEYPELDHRQALKFQRSLDYLNSISYDPITVKILSPGGSVDIGFLIYDCMKNSPSVIVSHSYGIAASMGSIIPQAAAERYISKNCGFMVHRISLADDGDMIRVKSGMEYTEMLMRNFYNIYAERCINGQFAQEHNMTLSKLKRFIINKLEKKLDWWMTAEEAVYYGFMDGVL